MREYTGTWVCMKVYESILGYESILSLSALLSSLSPPLSLSSSSHSPPSLSLTLPALSVLPHFLPLFPSSPSLSLRLQ